MPKNAEWPSEVCPAQPPATFQAPETAPQSRMRTRLSRRKPSLMMRGASADPPKTTRGRAWRDIGASDAEGFGAALAEEAGGTEDEHSDEEHEVDYFLPRGAEDVGADDLDARHDDGTEERPHHVAQAAQHHHHVSEEHELEPRRRVHGVERGDEHPRHAYAGDADGERQAVDAIDVDAHEGSRLAVLGGGPHHAARMRPLHEGEESKGEAEGDGEGDDLREVEGGAQDADDDRGLPGPHEAEIAGPEHESHVLERGGQSDGGEDLNVVAGPHHPAHHEGVDAEPDDEEEGRGHEEDEVRVDAPESEGPEREVHAQHQELAVGEVDHAHDAEDQRQPHRDEGVDAAQQHGGDEELGERRHLASGPAISSDPTGRAASTWPGGW